MVAYRPINLSTYRSIELATRQSTHQGIDISAYLSPDVSTDLSASEPINIPVINLPTYRVTSPRMAAELRPYRSTNSIYLSSYRAKKRCIR